MQLRGNGRLDRPLLLRATPARIEGQVAFENLICRMPGLALQPLALSGDLTRNCRNPCRLICFLGGASPLATVVLPFLYFSERSC